MHSFLDALRTQRWDDHRYYHHSRINQSLHLLSAISFVAAYVLLFIEPAWSAILAWCVSMVSRQAGHFFFEPRGYDHVNQAGHCLTTGLRHGDHWWCPPRDLLDRSMSSTSAMNMLILRGMVPKNTPPGKLYTYCKLWKKDQGRARYLLVRDPSREEMLTGTGSMSASSGGQIFTAAIAPYMITDASAELPALWGKVIVRIRFTQGHSSTAMLSQRDPTLRITRIGQKQVPSKEFPVILLHATTIAKLNSIKTHPWRPDRHEGGQLLRGRLGLRAQFVQGVSGKRCTG